MSVISVETIGGGYPDKSVFIFGDGSHIVVRQVTVLYIQSAELQFGHRRCGYGTKKKGKKKAI